MSLQDDYFDLDDALTAVPDRRQRAYARKCWKRIKARLHEAERHEAKYVEIMEAAGTLWMAIKTQP